MSLRLGRHHFRCPAWLIGQLNVDGFHAFNRGRRFAQALVLAAELPEEVRHLHVHYLHTPGSVGRYTGMLRRLPFSFSAHAKDIWTTPAWEQAEKLRECAWATTCTAAGAAELRALATELGLNERVRFLGFVPDTLRWMQAADGYVLTSRWEGLPMSVLEAAACGLPIVATDVPGTRGLFEEGLDGLRVKSGDAESLAESMRSVEAMPSGERVRMGAAARQHVEARYELEHVLRRWEMLYEQLRRD